MSMSDEIKRHQKAIENMQFLEQSCSAKPDMLDFLRHNADQIYNQYRSDASQVGALVRNLTQRGKWENKFVEALGGINWPDPFSPLESRESSPGSSLPTTASPNSSSPEIEAQDPELSPLKRFIGRYIPRAEASAEPSILLLRIGLAIMKHATSWTYVHGPLQHPIPGACFSRFEVQRVGVSPIVCEVVAYRDAASVQPAEGALSVMLNTCFFDSNIKGFTAVGEVSIADWIDCAQMKLTDDYATPLKYDFWRMVNGEWHWNDDLFACRRLSGKRVLWRQTNAP